MRYRLFDITMRMLWVVLLYNLLVILPFCNASQELSDLRKCADPQCESKI